MVAVAFVVHPDRAEAAEIAQRAGDWLRSRGHEVSALYSDYDHCREDGERAPEGLPTDAPAVLADAKMDLAVSLGGDGTMLRTVASIASRGVPVLGVNLGRLGYLTEVDPASLESALERFIAGEYRIEERMTLDVSLERRGAKARGGSEDPVFMVLNEASVEKTLPGHTIRVAASVAGRPLVVYAADGLLVATPTGSTAYNLSVRGPILSPQLRAILLTPVSPHMLFDRPLVLAPEEWVRLEVAPPRPAHLVLDGQRVASLEPGDAVACRPGKVSARLVTFGGRDFHAVLRARFNLADR